VVGKIVFRVVIDRLQNGVGGDGDTNAKSRFSKWFSAETNNTSDSRRSSVQDETIIKSLLKDLNEPSVSIPGDSNSYFAPISPAANTGTSLGAAGGGSKSINIMEMLQRGKQNESAMKSQVSGRIMNLNELEAKMRQNSEPQMHKHAQKSEEDMTAFNRLLAHISSGHNPTANGPMPKSQPMSLMEMLSHSQQQDEVHARMAQLLGPASPGASPHDIASRLQQSQQQHKQQQVEMLTKLMNAGMQVRASPLPEMGLQQSRELLNRPEAQAILQGLKVGDITPQHLYQQLANPALQPRHREMLVSSQARRVAFRASLPASFRVRTFARAVRSAVRVCARYGRRLTLPRDPIEIVEVFLLSDFYCKVICLRLYHFCGKISEKDVRRRKSSNIPRHLGFCRHSAVSRQEREKGEESPGEAVASSDIRDGEQRHQRIERTRRVVPSGHQEVCRCKLQSRRREGRPFHQKISEERRSVRISGPDER
jgi:hypothetical protein